MLHRETKESQAYALVASKGGIKLLPSKCEERKSETTDPKMCGNYTFSQQGVDGAAITMEALAAALGHPLQHLVIGRTGFTGTFDVHVEWTPDPSTPGFLVPDRAA